MYAIFFYVPCSVNKNFISVNYDDEKYEASLHDNTGDIGQQQPSKPATLTTDRKQRAWTLPDHLLCCSLPVPLSLADTLTMPLASMSKVTSTWGTPRGAGGIPTCHKRKIFSMHFCLLLTWPEVCVHVSKCGRAFNVLLCTVEKATFQL